MEWSWQPFKHGHPPGRLPQKWVLTTHLWKCVRKILWSQNVKSFGWTSEQWQPSSKGAWWSSVLSIIHVIHDQIAVCTYALDAMCFCGFSLYLRLEQQCEMESHFQNRRKDCKHAWFAPAGVAPLEILLTPFNKGRTAGNAATSLGCFL